MCAQQSSQFYGTDQPAPAIRHFQAGPISLEIEGGAVRYIRYNGHEAIRGVDYLVRDDSWRTPSARLTQISESSSADGFKVVFDGEVEQDDIHYRYRMTISGSEANGVEMRAEAEALSSFMTNRTGFVVLHPIVGVAGRPVIVTRKEGSRDEASFPEVISPGQPIFDIRALTHEVTPGLSVTCLMQADLPRDAETIYEMEDQRNWTDASYKTYVCSLLDPWPFEIAKGDQIVQSITVSFEGHAEPATGGSDGAHLRVGDRAAYSFPATGLGLMSKYRDELARTDHPAMQLRPQFFTAYVERDADGFDEIVGDFAAIANALRAEVQLELVLSQHGSPKAELDAAASACRAAGLTPARVIAIPRPYLRSIQPVGPWPEVCDLGHIYNMARQAFPNTKILGGMLTDFTELNRKRPPAATTDGITCTTTPIVHAADDRSVMETLETLPFTAVSMEAMAGGKPLHIGPSSIAMRHNPNGTATAPNPDLDRIPMADADPRQKGLFAAAWTLGYAAAIARSGKVSTLALNHLAGPSGLVGEDGAIYPVFHVMQALCEAGGQVRIEVDIDGAIAALGFESADRDIFLIANLLPEPQKLGLPAGLNGKTLDQASFASAGADPNWRAGPDRDLASELELGGFAVLFAHRSR